MTTNFVEVRQAAVEHDLNLAWNTYLKKMGTEEFQLTESELKADPLWVEASRVLWGANNNSDFEGDDEEAAQYGIRQISNFNYSFFQVDAPWDENDEKGLAEYMNSVDQMSDHQIAALNYMVHTYEAKDWTMAGFGRAIRSQIQDPSMWTGVGTIAALLGKFGGRSAMQKAFKHGLMKRFEGVISRAAAKKGVTIPTVMGLESGAYGGADDLMRQEFEAGLRGKDLNFEDYDWMRAGMATGLAGTAGVALPGVPMGGAALYRHYRPDSKVTKPIPPNTPEYETSESGDVLINRSMVDHDETDLGFPSVPQTIPEGDPLLVPTNVRYKNIGGNYKPGRQRRHNTIISNAMKGGDVAAEGEKPVVIFMGGGAAAGKSTIISKLLDTGVIPDHQYVMINPDDIKALLPETQQVKAKGDSRSAMVVHEESNDIAQQLNIKAASERKHIIIDKTLADPAKSMEWMRYYRDHGYEVMFIGVTVDPVEALLRAKQRYYNIGRLPPPRAMVKAHRGFNSGVDGYIDAADVAIVFDNTGQNPVEVMSKNVYSEGRTVHSPGEASKMVDRGNLNENSETLRELGDSYKKVSPEGSALDRSGGVEGTPKEAPGGGSSTKGSADNLAGERLETSPVPDSPEV